MVWLMVEVVDNNHMVNKCVGHWQTPVRHLLEHVDSAHAVHVAQSLGYRIWEADMDLNVT